jgi:hypothetical protein
VRASVDAAQVDVHVRARRGVRADVREQAVDHLAKLVAIAEHRDGVRGYVDRTRGVHDPCGVDRFADDPPELDVLPRERSPFVEAGEQQEVPCARTRARSRTSTAQRSSGCIAAPRSNSSPYARTAASGVRSSCDASATNRRSRCSDLSRARNADSVCASIALSDRPSRPDLRLRIGAFHPVRHVARGDRRGRRLDLAEREQAEPHDPEPEPAGRARRPRRRVAAEVVLPDVLAGTAWRRRPTIR